MSTVLIVESDAEHGRRFSSIIEELGHRVTIACGLADGLRSAAGSAYEMVILDDAAMGLDKPHAIGCLKDSPGKPEVVVITEQGDADTAELAIRSGAWDYLCRQRTTAEVVRSLERALAFREQKQVQARRALNLDGIIGHSRPMQACYQQVAQASATDANVLITGDSGTGKELFAKAIHENSRRRHHNMVVVDCAALPPTLIESVLFGHRKGAFTGAVDNRVGLIEQAHTGTLFLDEVAELPLALQKTFLRALQERRFRPVGAPCELRSDFRVIAATNRDLDDMVKAQQFRADLLFRLRTLALHLPPLCEREADAQEIATRLLGEICTRLGVAPKTISPQFYGALSAYSWPGNVRELCNALEQAVAVATDHDTLYPAHLPTEIRVHAARAAVTSARASTPVASCLGALPSLKHYRNNATRQYLLDLLVAARGSLRTACKLSGLSRSRLYALLKEHGVTAPRSTHLKIVAGG